MKKQAKLLAIYTILINSSGGVKMLDMWYGDSPKSADRVTISFYANDCVYRGNIFKNGKIIGDYAFNDWRKIEKTFPQLKFNWDV